MEFDNSFEVPLPPEQAWPVLMNVQGIGEKSFLKLRPHLTLGGAADAKPTKD